jgi:hypothetical protein
VEDFTPSSLFPGAVHKAFTPQIPFFQQGATASPRCFPALGQVPAHPRGPQVCTPGYCKCPSQSVSPNAGAGGTAVNLRAGGRQEEGSRWREQSSSRPGCFGVSVPCLPQREGNQPHVPPAWCPLPSPMSPQLRPFPSSVPSPDPTPA